jgi:hypothetical protein
MRAPNRAAGSACCCAAHCTAAVLGHAGPNCVHPNVQSRSGFVSFGHCGPNCVQMIPGVGGQCGPLCVQQGLCVGQFGATCVWQSGPFCVQIVAGVGGHAGPMFVHPCPTSDGWQHTNRVGLMVCGMGAGAAAPNAAKLPAPPSASHSPHVFV